MKWTVHGERAVYESDWVNLALADVELPDGHRFDHHVVRMPAQASGVVVSDPDRGVLLLSRHRFITDSWGSEVPAGRIDGESPRGAPRDARGDWLAAGASAAPHHLLPDQRHERRHVQPLRGRRRELRGHAQRPVRVRAGVEWLTWPQVRDEIAAGRVHDGLSLTALLWAITFERHADTWHDRWVPA